MNRTVLFVSGSSDQATVLASMLTPLDLELRTAGKLPEVSAALKEFPVGVVVTEAELADVDWHSVLQTVRERNTAIQTLVTRSRLDAHFWTDALEAGAYDIITQPLQVGEVQRLILSAWLKFEVSQPAAMKMPPSIARSLAARAAG